MSMETFSLLDDMKQASARTDLSLSEIYKTSVATMAAISAVFWYAARTSGIEDQPICLTLEDRAVTVIFVEGEESRYGEDCPGYRPVEDLMFQNEDISSLKRSQGKPERRRREKTGVSGTAGTVDEHAAGTPKWFLSNSGFSPAV
ncbi:hypothetical protein M406DRAFT_331696 [Cryphonectria parasitica EP155]|uniref:Uncharacterized protein n=1 Tax=Cryphonectria parasitica (strain ATCC 38755 / EP155) TaxID=660469 RepID=A0A9P4XXG3_CRYP1|nr:uncharacterized protein M406DRAFT_331696 [Cryphonectria parasitica EP155]KAF3763132.1 hypothetical protein M406DRAFT_331696 [Cryphonectria parasitica EP155]